MSTSTGSARQAATPRVRLRLPRPAVTPVLLALLVALLLACRVPAGAAAQGLPGGGQNRVQVELLPEPSTVRPGETFEVLLRMRLSPGWHTYWMNPGDSGLPTALQWQLPPGVTAGPLAWPVPKRLPVGPLMNYGYEGEVMLPVRLSVPAGFAAPVLEVSAQAEWLVCREVCIPESAPIAFRLPVATIASLPDPRHAAAFASVRAALPGRLEGWTIAAAVADGKLRIALRAPDGTAPPAGEVYFFNATEGQVAHAAAQVVSRHRNGLLVEVPLQPQPVTPVQRMDGLLVAAGGFGNGQPVAATIGADLSAGLPDLGPLLGTSTVAGAAGTPSGTAPAVAVAPASGLPAGGAGLLLALLLAVAGGLVLNLMPCVFPVLSLKALSMVERIRSDPRGLRMDGLAFSAGVLASFWALAALLLALRAGGEQVGWGFQLQSPPFVAAMAVLFTLLALNLAGVFEIGSRVASLAGAVPARKGTSGAFLNGVLAVAVAAPCTAPFMGAALGHALAQPAPAAMAVFGALALGMALPFLLLSFMPGLARRLPRPGRWMETFRQAMAFPLLATVAWLAWVLGLQAGMDAVFGLLAGLVLVALAAWLYGRFALPTASARRRTLAAAAALAVALAGGWIAWPAPLPDAGSSAPAAVSPSVGNADWEPWSAARVAALRAEGRPVFIDFTAAWCVTCQANKQLVLDTATVREAFAARDTALLRADWTRRDRAISEALTGYGRSGVPVYVLYLPGREAPILLPELLTREIVRAALSGQGG
jgi:thiol:disulfide interchange protein/DsbC/DsbD-like thiol-disulfide interchange protein